MDNCKRQRNKWFILYPIADFIIIAGLSLLMLLTVVWSKTQTSSVTLEEWIGITIYCTSSALITVVVLALFGTYKMLTRNFGLYDAMKVALISIICQLLMLLPLRLIDGKYIPQVSIFTALITFLAISFILPSLRVVFRAKDVIKSMFKKNTIRTLVIGAGGSAKIAIDETRNNSASNKKVVLVVDDDPSKFGTLFLGIKVAGPIRDINKFIKQFDIEEVIIAISNLSDKRLREILGYLISSNVRIKRMPLLSEMDGPNDLHTINVDLNELLCRPVVKLDNSKVNDELHNKTVLVTGAGGSIGSELVRQIFEAHPSTLILFDIYENSNYDIQQELMMKIRKDNITDVDIVTLIGSTYNEKRVEQIFKKYKPDYIYHAAAYKHVPLMEDSPAEAIRTNVIGTYNVAKMADKYKATKMVLVSTDKAVRPTNVMGATKRFAETIIQYFAEKSQNTIYAATRFGNVLGSNGSVVPLFKKQIEAGGPITITDKNIIRYFMTIPEAVSLILQCGLFAKHGEIFILDMGEPVKIIDLAINMIRQAGLIPYKDIDIVETQLRPGEKLYEELLLDKEHQTKTENEKIYVEQICTLYSIDNEISKIVHAFDMDKNDDIKILLSQIVTDYKFREM